ncbi:MAG: PQQ-binding-like beta-propeller repeat protein, partial [Phycisphaerae bacterium]|nr:PQQ-binding-like beta-propeller repeat protein [Phycisphaerae bacterium]
EDQSITSTPAVVDGVILIGSDDGYLYAFEARP